eukprot:TRINITY_DN794_c0_g1_i2.p1 TRINITY_DN794_c0_g1~~TRINITY_DN794_c0_g1_i2.p1  ORF type:complete len:219 (-),score=26.85 TRINITY_DN794_c0_g1_i2:206-862(-)
MLLATSSRLQTSFLLLPKRFSHLNKRALGGLRLSSFVSGYTALSPKPLQSIIEVERFKSLPAEEISEHWTTFHIGRGHICTTLSSQKYGLLEQRANSCVYFVVPVKKSTGYITMFMQAKMPHVLFTGLEDYKAKGSDASPHLTVTYYKEFAESKGLVLVRGDVVLPSKLSDEEAKTLLEDAHSFYLNDSRYRLVEQFNRESKEFEFKDVLRALEMPSC